MQPKFTQKKPDRVIRKLITALMAVMVSVSVFSQTTLTATYSPVAANGLTGSSGVTFVLNNTNASARLLTAISLQLSTTVGTGTTNCELWVTSTPSQLSGGVTVAAPNWSLISSANGITIANALTPVFTNINFIMNANTVYRFAVRSSNGIYYEGTGATIPTPNTFTGDGVSLNTGNFQISGLNVGWTGAWPNMTANNPRFFRGSVTFGLAVPCSGTPSPGNTIAAPTAACPGSNFTLSLQNSTPGTGVTYQWQSGPANTGPWTPISGATNATYVGTQTTATWYRCVVTCGANSANSNPVQVTMENIDNCYCIPVYTNGCTFGDFIARVQLGTLNNASTCSTPPFTFFSAVAAPVLIQGATYPLSITVGPDTFGQRCAAWIDYNRDGDFNDAGEFLGNTGDAGPGGTVTINVTIPTGTNIGTTRLRVRGGDDNPTSPTAGQSCGATASTFGEAEDYNVNIQPCVPVSSITGLSNITTQCSQNATFTINIGSASLPTIGWEYRAGTSGPWTLATNGNNINGAVISGATTTSMTLTAVPTSISGYQFRAFVSNPCTGPDVSAISTLTVSQLVTTLNTTNATICNGTIQPISLTNVGSTSTTTFSSGPLSIQIPDIIGPPASPPAVCNAGINHTIPVALPLGASVSRIDVRLNITHTFASDLIIVLKNQTTNQTINLFYHKSANFTAGGNFTNTVISSAGTRRFSQDPPPFTNGPYRADLEPAPGFYLDNTGVGPTAFQPTTNLWSTLIGTPGQASGNWTLAICDPEEWAGDIGTLTSWDITFTYGAPSTGIFTANPAAPNTMFTDAAATVPYTGTPINTIYVKPAVTTTYCVTYNTTSPACNGTQACATVNVVQPLGTITQPVDRTVCVGGTTSFSVIAAGGPFGYQWQESRDNGISWNNVSNGGVYSGATTSTLTLTGVTRSAPVDMNNFLYRCNVNTAPCSGSFTTNVVKLTVNALPSVTITASDLALLPNQTATITGTSTPAPNATPNWVWTRDGSAVVGSTSSIVADIDRLGVYQASVTDVNGCRNSSNQLLIEAEAGEKLWIYPNPTAGQFQIRMYYPGVVNEKRRIQIFNTSGQEVMSRDIMLNTLNSPHYQRFDVDLSFQPAGTYLVRVIDLYTKKSMSGFIIKQGK